MRLVCSLPNHSGSYAILRDKSSVDTAVLFVHGFRLLDVFDKAAYSAWVNFQNLTGDLEDKFPWWRSCDLYFWSYASSEDRIPFSAQDLQELVQQIYPRPIPGLLTKKGGHETSCSFLGMQLAVPDPGSGRLYSKLLLVGHSEGAVVIRQAIWNIFKAGKSVAASAGSPANVETYNSVLHAEVRLFAPAYMGASLSGLWGFLYKFTLTRPIVEPLLSRSPAFQDLQPTNRTLHNLQVWTEEAAKAHPELRAFRARLLFGRKEHSVHPGAYECDDDSEEAERNESHTTVCKPRRDYIRPLEFVKHAAPNRVSNR